MRPAPKVASEIAFAKKSRCGFASVVWVGGQQPVELHDLRRLLGAPLARRLGGHVAEHREVESRRHTAKQAARKPSEKNESGLCVM
jgi:hypothetical protein